MDRVKRSTKAAPHLIAVGPKDKENLASPDVLLKCKRAQGEFKKTSFLKGNSRYNNKNMEMMKNKLNNFRSEQLGKKEITADDLTSENPGESYWEQLSESRRVALEATWKENMGLHSKVMELEYENTKLKAMLAEAKNSIQILTELLDENESVEDDIEEHQDNLNQDLESDADASLVDASFTSV